MRQAFAGLLGCHIRLTSRIQPQLGLRLSESFSLHFCCLLGSFLARLFFISLDFGDMSEIIGVYLGGSWSGSTVV